MPPLVTVENLKTYFDTDHGVVKAVDDVSFVIPRGGVLGVVGESGSGKSVTAMSIIRLLASPGYIAGGRVLLHRQDDAPPVVLSALPEPEMRRIRGSEIAMIFQEPMTSLNPVFTVGAQIMEAILLHQKTSKQEARNRAIELLQRVRVPDPQRRVDDYPHQFSGGMRQRAMIAMALACNPKLLIADEPTTALDVTIQAQILDLLRELQAETGMSILMITHDLGIIAEIADEPTTALDVTIQAQILDLLRELQAETGMSILMITHDLGIIAEIADEVAVMYASQIVERASVQELFTNPKHPYTIGLFESRPEPGKPKAERLTSIPGMVPSPLRFPSGCKFHPRCRFSQPDCAVNEPVLRELSPGHLVRCPYAESIAVTLEKT